MAKVVRKIEAAAPVPVKLKRVAAYARVSMETERLNHSLSAQVSYYSELIQKHPGWVYAGVYADSDEQPAAAAVQLEPQTGSDGS